MTITSIPVAGMLMSSKQSETYYVFGIFSENLSNCPGRTIGFDVANSDEIRSESGECREAITKVASLIMSIHIRFVLSTSNDMGVVCRIGS